MNFLHLALAGIWPFIFHWGIGVGIIILCLSAAFFSNAIPIIGPWLGTVRKDLEWIAAATAVFLMALAIGAHDEAARCKAKSVIVEKIVTKAVTDTELPQAEKAPDPWDEH